LDLGTFRRVEPLQTDRLTHVSDTTSLRDFLEIATTPVNRPDLEWELERLRTRNQQLTKALVSRATIDQAKGVIMAAGSCSADDAFRVLVAMSQRLNIPLRDVASAVVYSASHQRS
jgi:AmiR/NasT family two-component response regulator